MILPPISASGRRPAGRRMLAAFGLVLVLAVGRTATAADDDPFTATVPVDATADSIVKAREMARLDGQRKALAAVADKLSAGAAAKMPKLDDKTITDLVTSFAVANERMSAVRYLADYTFHFRPEETRRALHITAAGAPAGEPGGKPVVLLPVFQSGGQARLWDDPNPWRDAWNERNPGGATRLVVPLGDAGDIAAIDAEKARAGNTDALAAEARRNGGDEAIVATATVKGDPDRPEGIDIDTKRYRGGRLVNSHSASLPTKPGESPTELVRRAVGETLAGINGGWKKEAPIGYDQQGSLTAVLPISSLDDWVKARDRIAALPSVKKLALVTLSRQEATIEIGYLGSIDQLKTALAGANLDLVRGDATWRLARPGTAP